jgi:hypothetical protein
VELLACTGSWWETPVATSRAGGNIGREIAN